MIDFIWDFFQQGQISDLQNSRSADLEKSRYQDQKISGTDNRLRQLEQRHEQLKLVTLAMWTLLKEHSGLIEGDLKKYIHQVDLMDGKLDGKVNTKEKVDCGGCGRTILTTSLTCPYCGTELIRSNPFANA